MLGNKRRDFAEEILSVIILDVLTGFLLGTTKEGGLTDARDYFMAFFVPLLIYFPAIRLFRYAFVYRAYVVLYSICSFFIIVLLFVGVEFSQNVRETPSRTTGSLTYFLIILTATIIYTIYILLQRKRGLFKKTVPPERIQVLRATLTCKEKFTLIIPDRYIRFLETGDKGYLER